MLRSRLIRILMLIGSIALLVFLYWQWQSSVLSVDTGAVSRGPLKVAIVEDGKTRIKERYVVSSPLEGTLLRIDLEAGDKVYGGKTEVAVLQPLSPKLLDDREIKLAEAKREAALLSVQQTRANRDRVSQAFSLAEKNHQRVLQLQTKKSISQQEVDISDTEYRLQRTAMYVAELAEKIANFELGQAEAALLHHSQETDLGDTPSFTIKAPIDGQVLRIFQESRGVVQPGTPLLEIGDSASIEIETDVLSSDAVKISEGNEVLIERWGEEQPLHGKVTRVEPAAYTKISSLGVEEQRVNVIIDILEPPAQRPTLGDAFQVDTKIFYWKSADCLQIPIGALIRENEDWAVYKVSEGKAISTKIKIGQRNHEAVEVLEGLEPGDIVVIYPSDQLKSGSRVRSNTST